MRKVTHC